MWLSVLILLMSFQWSVSGITSGRFDPDGSMVCLKVPVHGFFGRDTGLDSGFRSRELVHSLILDVAFRNRIGDDQIDRQERHRPGIRANVVDSRYVLGFQEIVGKKPHYEAAEELGIIPY